MSQDRIRYLEVLYSGHYQKVKPSSECIFLLLPNLADETPGLLFESPQNLATRYLHRYRRTQSAFFGRVKDETLQVSCYRFILGREGFINF